MKIRTYQELLTFDNFYERLDYLTLAGKVGADTFGYDRHINQKFYKSTEWAQVRSYVIVRDSGCDLACPDYDIYDRILIHHMNPMTPENIKSGDDSVINPDFLITTCHSTHNAIHYGFEHKTLPRQTERRSGDTRLW